MTVAIFFLLSLAIVFKADSTGSFDYGQNITEILSTNSIRAADKFLNPKMSLVKRKNIIINEKGDVNRRVKREGLEDRCAFFNSMLTHPHPMNDSKYYRDIDCVTVISGAEGTILELKFVDLFDIEYHPQCDYDFLEIRDGTRGYATLLGGKKLCGQQFPGAINTTGPHAWLKFHSDETIEREGFKIKVTEIQSTKSHVVPESCHIKHGGNTGILDIKAIDQKCKDDSINQALEVLWTIEAEKNHRIALNFTTFKLAEINSCKDNVVQVFGSVIEFDSRLAHFCGSIAEPVSTILDSSKEDFGNIMNIRFYSSKAIKDLQKFIAQYTVFRQLDTSGKSDKCVEGEEYDCQDGTCIDIILTCDNYANCRMKADEQPELCKGEIDVFTKDLQVIVIILSLIVSLMTIIFLFKCFRKLYLDQKIIKENLKNSMENGLDDLCEIRLALDDKSERDSQVGAFLEKEKEKEKLIKQSKSKLKKSSMDSIFDQESRFDSDIVLWRKEVDSVPEAEKIKVEYNGFNGKNKRSDLSKKEESLRMKKDGKDKKDKIDEKNLVEQNKKTADENNVALSLPSALESEKREKDEKKEVSVGTTDVKEFGCQTRESLFLTDPPRSSDASSKSRVLPTIGFSEAITRSRSSSNSQGLPTIGFSEAYIRPSAPSPPKTTASGMTTEVLNNVKLQGSQKKTPDRRRPMSAETTRSAPDVIILAKPIGDDV